MVTGTLLFDACIAAAAAAIYAWVGNSITHRSVSPEAQRAASMFAVWWFALAGTTLLGAFAQALVGFGIADIAIHQAITQVALLLLTVALWSLVYYLAYLFSGWSGLFWPLTAVYVAAYVGLVWLIVASGPTGVSAGRWRVSVDYATPLQGPALQVIVAALIVPIILGAVAYLSIFFRVTEPEPRYRIAMVGTSLLVWFSSAYAVRAAGFVEHDAWAIASRFLGLGAALAIFLAYHPPAWVRRRWAAREAAATPA